MLTGRGICPPVFQTGMYAVASFQSLIPIPAADVMPDKMLAGFTGFLFHISYAPEIFSGHDLLLEPVPFYYNRLFSPCQLVAYSAYIGTI